MVISLETKSREESYRKHGAPGERAMLGTNTGRGRVRLRHTGHREGIIVLGQELFSAVGESAGGPARGKATSAERGFRELTYHLKITDQLGIRGPRKGEL